jgi:hypothetical protein
MSTLFFVLSLNFPSYVVSGFLICLSSMVLIFKFCVLCVMVKASVCCKRVLCVVYSLLKITNTQGFIFVKDLDLVFKRGFVKKTWSSNKNILN